MHTVKKFPLKAVLLSLMGVSLLNNAESSTVQDIRLHNDYSYGTTIKKAPWGCRKPIVERRSIHPFQEEEFIEEIPVNMNIEAEQGSFSLGKPHAKHHLSIDLNQPPQIDEDIVERYAIGSPEASFCRAIIHGEDWLQQMNVGSRNKSKTPCKDGALHRGLGVVTKNKKIKSNFHKDILILDDQLISHMNINHAQKQVQRIDQEELGEGYTMPMSNKDKKCVNSKTMPLDLCVSNSQSQENFFSGSTSSQPDGMGTYNVRSAIASQEKPEHENKQRDLSIQNDTAQRHLTTLIRDVISYKIKLDAIILHGSKIKKKEPPSLLFTYADHGNQLISCHSKGFEEMEPLFQKFGEKVKSISLELYMAPKVEITIYPAAWRMRHLVFPMFIDKVIWMYSFFMGNSMLVPFFPFQDHSSLIHSACVFFKKWVEDLTQFYQEALHRCILKQQCTSKYLHHYSFDSTNLENIVLQLQYGHRGAHWITLSWELLYRWIEGEISGIKMSQFKGIKELYSNYIKKSILSDQDKYMDYKGFCDKYNWMFSNRHSQRYLGKPKDEIQTKNKILT